MKYSDWDPIYKAILIDFGFEQEKDDEAAEVASELIARKREVVETVKREVEMLLKGKIA